MIRQEIGVQVAIRNQAPQGATVADITEMHTHQLGPDEEVTLCVADFVVLEYVRGQTTHADGWIREPNNKIGIAKAASESLGKNKGELAKAALERCAELDFIKIKRETRPYGKKIERVVNARELDLGGRILDSLADFYRPLIPAENFAEKLGIVSSLVQEIKHMTGKVLGEEPPAWLIKLEDPDAIDRSNLTNIIADLMATLNAKADAIDKLPKESRKSST